MLVGPGEGAGVVDVGDGIAAAIRIESHNHPSAIEPYQGAATGVGGILRDIFTMGARPIALDGPAAVRPARRRPQPLDRRGRRVGHLRLRQLGRRADRRRRDRLRRDLRRQPARQRALPRRAARSSGSCSAGRRASATSRCCSARRTGRDGIGGVSVLASAGFGDDEADAAKRPSVQVGDPFEEKRLIEACLELLDAGLAVGIQDLGGAGLTVRHVARPRRKAASGMDVVRVARCPQREPGMEPFEVMTSRVARSGCSPSSSPSDLDEVLAICRAVGGAGLGHRRGHRRRAGCASSTGFGGEVLADVPAASLHEDAPLYDRPRAEPADLRRAPAPTSPPTLAGAGADLGADLLGHARRHVVGVAPVRPPAVPQHRRGARRRRRRAAAEAPDHRRRHRPRPSPSPPTATTAGAPSTPGPGTALGRGRAVLNLAVRRRPARSPSSTASTSATPSTPR